MTSSSLIDKLNPQHQKHSHWNSNWQRGIAPQRDREREGGRGREGGRERGREGGKRERERRGRRVCTCTLYSNNGLNLYTCIETKQLSQQVEIETELHVLHVLVICYITCNVTQPY